MANTFAIGRCIPVQGPRSHWMPEVVTYNITAGQTFFNGAVVITSSGNASEAANLPTTAIIGVALHAAQAVYNPGTTAVANQEIPYIGVVFGESQFSTKLQPGDAQQAHVVHGIPGQWFEATAVNVAWSSTNHTWANFGLRKDTTTNYWVVDLASTTNTCVTVIGLAQKPLMIPGTSPAVAQGGAMPGQGDTNPRVLFYFQSATVV